jgi:hypothetical protein
MRLHLFLGSVGANFLKVSEKIQPLLIEKNNSSEKHIEIKFGGYGNWDETKAYNYDGWNKRLKKFIHNNPSVEDVIILGPGALLNAKRFIEDYQDVSLYFLEKNTDLISPEELLENFYQKFQDSINADKTAWLNFIDKTNTIYNELKTQYQPSMTLFGGFLLEENSINLNLELKQEYMKIGLVKLNA